MAPVSISQLIKDSRPTASALYNPELWEAHELLETYHQKTLAIMLFRQRYERDNGQYERCVATGRISTWLCCPTHITFSEMGQFDEAELRRALPHIFPRIGRANAFSELWWKTLGYQFPSWSNPGVRLTD